MVVRTGEPVSLCKQLVKGLRIHDIHFTFIYDSYTHPPPVSDCEMPGTGRADVSPSQFDMQWRTRVGCEEFWATFPVLSPRPEIHTEGLIPIRMGTSQMRELLESARSGKQSAGLEGDPSASRRTSSATPLKTSSRGSSVVARTSTTNCRSSAMVSQRSSQAAAALMLEGSSVAGAISDLRQQLQQERILRQKAEDEARDGKNSFAAGQASNKCVKAQHVQHVLRRLLFETGRVSPP
eukprot:s726_g38.t1